jgi:hypothetical protein
MTDQRGGMCIKTGLIGRVNCLRQQLIAPGEKITPTFDGKVLLEATRERETLRINGHLGVFLTPLRWLEPNFVQILKEGFNTAASISEVNKNDLASYGIGADGTNTRIPKFFEDNLLRIYNEWYKWPEDNDITSWPNDGPPAVPLQRAWSRCRYNIDPEDTNDYVLPSATSFDVRDLAEVQAKFRSAMERDVLSYNRYMELIGEMFGAKGSPEVDQVPRMIDQTDIGVSPRELPATDSAGLGDWQSIYDFGVEHRVEPIIAPEHCVLTYMLTMRFAPIIESRNPHAIQNLTWEDLVGDPEVLRNMKPQEVTIRDICTNNGTTSLGYLPAGWRWKMGWDVVGRRIDDANSFPMMNQPSSKENAKDATRIKDAFRSAALGHYIVDLDIGEASRNLHGSALESYFSGMTGAASNAEIPKQGKMV